MEPFTFFISYRREDTAPIALLLKYEIEKRLQFVRVFVDVDAVPFGEPFPDRIRSLIDKAHATIALIGKNWMPRLDASKPSADTDWVATELHLSDTRPLGYGEENRYGLEKRKILPIFVEKLEFKQFVLPQSLAHLKELNSQKISYESWPRDIGGLVENIAVLCNVKKRPDKDEYPEPDWAKARTQPVPDQQLADTLKYKDYEGWYVDNFGDSQVRYLTKTFEFHDFNEASDFMRLILDHCRVLDHHPEWRNVFKHVTVSLTTWDAKRRVTIYDLNLALYMNKAATAVLNKRRGA